MDSQLDIKLAGQYKSKSQKIRVMTEKWLHNYGYCPYCGNPSLNYFKNNKPVADFLLYSMS